MVRACPRWLGQPLAAALLLGLAWPLSASAQSGLGYLKNSPINYFNNEDIKLMRAAADKLLSSGADGARSEWSNPKTGHSGEVEVLKSYTADSMPCKRMRVVNHAKGLSSDAQYPLCKYPGKGWRIRQEPAAK